MTLDDEEREIQSSFEQGDWESVENLQGEKARYQTYAAASQKKDKRINIRLSAHDLEALQFIAVKEGLPYQTLIASLLHKFVTGSLVVRTDRTEQLGKDADSQGA